MTARRPLPEQIRVAFASPETSASVGLMLIACIMALFEGNLVIASLFIVLAGIWVAIA